MTKYGVVLAIMDMASAKSDVNGPKKKVCSCNFELESDNTHNFSSSLKLKDSLSIGPG